MIRLICINSNRIFILAALSAACFVAPVFVSVYAQSNLTNINLGNFAPDTADANPAPTQGVIATAFPDSVSVGEPIFLSVTFKTPKGAQVIPPETDKGFGDFAVLSVNDESSVGKDNDTALYRYHLAVYKPENCTIPSLNFLMKRAESDTLFDTLRTASLPVRLVSVIPPGTPDSALVIRDLKAQQQAGRPSLHSLWLLLVAILAIAAYCLFERYAKKNAKETAPAVPLKPPYEEALDALDALEKKKYLEQGKAKEYTFELTEIFKRYVGRRYDTIAPELTTGEIVTWLEYASGINRETRVSAEWFLRTSDQVKFAKWTPDSQTLNRFIKEVRAFLEVTKPEPELPNEQRARKPEAAK